MERSFAQSTRYGFDRSRWRGLWKASIQEYLVTSIQNIKTLIRHTGNPAKVTISLFRDHKAHGPHINLWYLLFFGYGGYFFTILNVLTAHRCNKTRATGGFGQQAVKI